MGSRSTSGTYELWFERLIGAKREVVFGMFTEPGGQVALYRQNEPGWIVRSECAGLGRRGDALPALGHLLSQPGARQRHRWHGSAA
jgi:hypothetical protein